MPADLWFESLQRPGAEVQDRGTRLAGGLRRLGLEEGGVVAVLLRNDPVFADVVFACRTAGTYYCPVNWHFMAEEVRYLLEDSGAAALIVHADLLPAVQSAVPAGVAVLVVGGTHPDGIAYEPWLAAQAPYDGPRVAPRGHLAYTSGTTGRPKGVLRQPVPLADLEAQQARLRSLIRQAYGIVPGCRALMSAPLYHSAPSVYVQNALQMAERLVLAPRFDAEQVLALVEKHRIDVLYLVPIMYVRLLKLPAEVRAKYDLSSIRFVASTGSPCSPEVKRAMLDWFGPVIHETYASSEAGLVTVATPEDAAARPGTAGRPVDDASVRIIDENGKPCAPGEVGLVYVRQPAYPDFTYLNNDKARRAIDIDGHVTLGDMGYLDADGYLFICDRASDMVISGGVNIYPAEIEHELVRYPGVADCVVFGVPDDEYGERLHGVIEPTAGTQLESAAVIEWLRGRLSGFKVPRSIEIVERLPRDETGKLAKRRLRDQHWAGRQRRV
ncbi:MULTISPECIES: acyl-CoA synthetase [unclassified Cupriavidus]|uniref:acyl-CoA synthetase n=1 Tax=unclassified Cupriavidus TaxID=2640874 RepID=UPI001C007924|nr:MULTISPECIES: acyl-CoA synthetase [unclassified Cupriavidus]MCA3193184.1 acyl-CoA synthetase [Cupriavidus sp.]MCA3194722.1 acyl-CoA synthetase [Cupriavidus sp.]MCA3203010.1 acyl-CoA synthetase [Cupriavidus sp.]MCA3208877.1 acyl-CoA synthetase [Cupriavidus sp.]MCA3233497.1 acyl-CoA synthetase [Cupriavidus sp.]